MPDVVSFRTNILGLLDELSSGLTQSAPKGLSTKPDDVEVLLGVGETWFTLDAALIFGTGVASNIIANHISDAIRLALSKFSSSNSQAKEPSIEVRLNGRRIEYATMAELCKALQSSLAPKSDKQV
jgi:hypothetical protein